LCLPYFSVRFKVAYLCDKTDRTRSASFISPFLLWSSFPLDQFDFIAIRVFYKCDKDGYVIFHRPRHPGDVGTL
jgi:hypothetical protein